MKHIPLNQRIIFALDVASAEEAYPLIDRLGERIQFFKVGLQLFFAAGWPLIDYLNKQGKQVMLDLKLYDIPATVRLAVQQFADRGIRFTTVHGYAPVVEAALEAQSNIDILAVTVLTSMGDAHLQELGFPGTVQELVTQRAKTVTALGCQGIVCSAQEAAMLRQEVGNDFIMVTPGIRPAGAAQDDQQRIATPGAAIAAGADHLVIGRPIRDAEHPLATIEAIEQDITLSLQIGENHAA